VSLVKQKLHRLWEARGLRQGQATVMSVPQTLSLADLCKRKYKDFLLVEEHDPDVVKEAPKSQVP
jgi:hypothetical protein